MRVLVAGATGTVGRRLVAAVLDAGHDVRCLTRSPEKLAEVPWGADVEVHRGDLDRPQSLIGGFDGVAVAVYLVHALADQVDGLVDRERSQAESFREAADDAGVKRIVYLGGLIDEDRLREASDHMYARYVVGRTLADGRADVTEIRAGIVLGADSASFRMLAAAERVPVQVEIPAGRSRVQPIALEDIVRILTAAVERDDLGGRILEAGGPDVVTYHELVERYLEARGGGRRPKVTLPYAPAEAAAPLTSLLSGVDQRVALSLLGSLRHDAVIRGDDAGMATEVEPMGLDDALRAALADR